MKRFRLYFRAPGNAHASVPSTGRVLLRACMSRVSLRPRTAPPSPPNHAHSPSDALTETPGDLSAARQTLFCFLLVRDPGRRRGGGKGAGGDANVNSGKGGMLPTKRVSTQGENGARAGRGKGRERSARCVLSAGAPLHAFARGG